MQRRGAARLFAAFVVITMLLSPITGAFAAPVTTTALVQEGPSPASGIKVMAATGVLDASQPGVTLWQDYGAFALYKVSEEALTSLPAEAQSQIETDPNMDKILFERHPVDTLSGQLDIPQALAIKEPAGAALQLVQFVGPIQQSWLDAITAAGATPVQYIANYAYMVWADAAARIRLGVLAKTQDFVQYSVPYQPAFKLGQLDRKPHLGG